MAGTRPRDPYEVLGVARDADETADQEGLPRASRASCTPTSTRTTPTPRRSSRRRPRPTRSSRTPSAARPTTATATRACARAATRRTSRASARSPTSSTRSSAARSAAASAATRGGPVQGGDVAVGVEITLAEAADGRARSSVSFEAVDTCERCHGNGAEPGTPIDTCERCGGAGVLQAVVALAVRAGRAPGRLRRLRRRGPRPRAAVPAVRRARTGGAPSHAARSTCPPGIADGQRIRLAGRGHAGERGGPPGDLYVLVHVRARRALPARRRRPRDRARRPRAARRAGRDAQRPVARRRRRRRGAAGHAAGRRRHRRRQGHAAPAPARAPRRPARGRQRRHPAQAQQATSATWPSSWPTR